MNAIHKVINVLSDPSHLQLIIRDALGARRKVDRDEVHLDEAVCWVFRAQDATSSGGISGGYYPLHGGWIPSYPETTGYTIPSLLDYLCIKNAQEILDRVIRMGDWEIGIQMDSGAVRGGVGLNAYPVVFNTGQVVHGWVALFERTGEKRFINAAIRASDWLCSVQDEDGKWSRFTHYNALHSYKTLVSWGLLKMHFLTGKSEYLACVRKNIRWTLNQVNENGWFRYMNFKGDEPPLTHTIAYTLQGIIECSEFMDKDERNEIDGVVSSASERLLKRYLETKGRIWAALPATFDENWKPVDSYSCVTGDIQIAIVWLRMY